MNMLAQLFSAKRKPDRAIDAISETTWTPTHKHRKGGFYRRIATAVLEVDRSDVVIYDDRDGTVWVRPVAEFDDGRFTAIPD